MKCRVNEAHHGSQARQDASRLNFESDAEGGLKTGIGPSFFDNGQEWQPMDVIFANFLWTNFR